MFGRYGGKTMLKTQKPFLIYLILFIAFLLLGHPTVARAEGNGRILKSNLTGEMVVQREDGTNLTVDYSAVMISGIRGQQIVINVIGAGVVRETGEQIVIDVIDAGIVQREGNQAQFNTSGLFIFERENGNRVSIDITSVGVLRVQGQAVELTFSSSGVVRGSSENIVINVIGAGIRSR
jgi:hypothetical protein